MQTQIRELLYQIGIRCLGATYALPSKDANRLYQIGIRCLGATQLLSTIAKTVIISDWNSVSRCNHNNYLSILFELYQIGIRCLGATKMDFSIARRELYQIGIRCLGATPLPQTFQPMPLYQIVISYPGAFLLNGVFGDGTGIDICLWNLCLGYF